MQTNTPPLRAYLAYFVAAIFLCYEMALQTSPSIMVQPLMAELHINAAQLGIMAACYFYSYTLMQISAGLLYDRFNVRSIMALALLLCSMGALLFAHSHSMLIAGLGRFLMGIGSAFAFLGVLTVAHLWFPKRYYAFLVGIAQLLAALGALGGELPLAALVQHIGWRATMLTLFFIGLAIVLLTYAIIPKQKPTAITTKQPIWPGLAIILKCSQTWWIALYAFCTWAPIVIFAAMWGIPFLMQAYQLTNTQAALAIALIWIGLGLTSPILGWFSNKAKRRSIFLSACTLMGALVSFSIIYLPSPSLTFSYILLLCFGIATAGQILSFDVVRDNNCPELIGTATGLNNMAVVAGGALLQPLAAYLLNYFWDGTQQHGVAIYSVHAYKIALSLIPLCFFIAFLVSIWGISETRCQPTGKIHT